MATKIIWTVSIVSNDARLSSVYNHMFADSSAAEKYYRQILNDYAVCIMYERNDRHVTCASYVARPHMLPQSIHLTRNIVEL